MGGEILGVCKSNGVCQKMNGKLGSRGRIQNIDTAITITFNWERMNKSKKVLISGERGKETCLGI